MRFRHPRGTVRHRISRLVTFPLSPGAAQLNWLDTLFEHANDRRALSEVAPTRLELTDKMRE
jgi:hypothetical protein